MGWMFRIGVGAAIATCAAAVAAAALPGPHRLACPPCFGLSEIAPRVFTDAPAAEHRRIRQFWSRAEKDTAAFFGPLQSRPITVICQQGPCIETFSSSSAASGVTFGWQAIRIAPRGVRQTIITHERIHAELHWRLGVVGLARNAIPAWFDEGLAVLLSGDRVLLRYAQRTRRNDKWITDARWPWQWSRMVAAHGWRDSYAAAVTRVAGYEQRIGRGGLRRVVEAVISGADFETALHSEITAAAR